MKIIDVRNVREALPEGIHYLLENGRIEDSRAGKVLVAPGPVATVYQRPQERVLLSPIRDANPFFHLFESLHMLAGRDDARWLDTFVKDFSSRFAEEDGTQHGAYGHRWRQAFGFDQLDAIVDILKKDPTSRQCVLRMWDSTVFHGGYAVDPDFGMDDLRGVFKDRPCNLCVMFRIREVWALSSRKQKVLDITVCCRSNDICWGCYGSNSVHFSVLQEVMAARIGVGIGTYVQFSHNYHIYTDILEKVKGVVDEPSNAQGYGIVCPMVTVPDRFDEDLRSFMAWTDTREHGVYLNPWFSYTAEPLFAAYGRWRSGDRTHALALLNGLWAERMAPDWRLAAQQWMERRINK